MNLVRLEMTFLSALGSISAAGASPTVLPTTDLSKLRRPTPYAKATALSKQFEGNEQATAVPRLA